MHELPSAAGLILKLASQSSGPARLAAVKAVRQKLRVTPQAMTPGVLDAFRLVVMQHADVAQEIVEGIDRQCGSLAASSPSAQVRSLALQLIHICQWQATVSPAVVSSSQANSLEALFNQQLLLCDHLRVRALHVVKVQQNLLFVVHHDEKLCLLSHLLRLCQRSHDLLLPDVLQYTQVLFGVQGEHAQLTLHVFDIELLLDLLRNPTYKAQQVFEKLVAGNMVTGVQVRANCFPLVLQHSC